jgi:hypothetical protein
VVSSDQVEEVLMVVVEHPVSEAPALAPRGPRRPAERLTGAPAVEHDERAARAALRAQIARLEAEVGDMVIAGFPHIRFPGQSRLRGSGRGRLLSFGELERRRDELAERLQRGRAAVAARTAEQERNRVLLERMLLEPKRYKFARLANADLGEGGCGYWEVRPRLGIIGMLAGWWHVKLSSGCPLATEAGLDARPWTLPARRRAVIAILERASAGSQAMGCRSLRLEDHPRSSVERWWS